MQLNARASRCVHLRGAFGRLTKIELGNCPVCLTKAFRAWALLRFWAAVGTAGRTKCRPGLETPCIAVDKAPGRI